MNSTARTVLLIVLIIFLISLLPTWGYIGGSFYPSGGVGLLLVIFVLLILFGKI